mmetsp:Transcript_143174/g.252701  ORF Transcript_143174/g.252701 Transcript_143174/m.252701 type:complete len:381 (-) Transcript_143174:81-1223(-)
MNLPLERGVTALPARRRRLFSAPSVGSSTHSAASVRSRNLPRPASTSLSGRRPPVKSPSWSALIKHGALVFDTGGSSSSHRLQTSPALQSSTFSCWSQVSAGNLVGHATSQHWMCRHSQRQSEKQYPPRPRSRSGGQQARCNESQASLPAKSALKELLPPREHCEPHDFPADGLWWQWQQQGPFGWEDIEADANAQLEEAYAQGQSSCSFWVAGVLHVCNLDAMRKQESLSRIRRVRMPVARLGSVPVVLPENVPDTWDGLGAWAFSQVAKQDDGAKLAVSRLVDLSDPLFLDLVEPVQEDPLSQSAFSAEDPEATTVVSPEAPLPTRSAWGETSASKGALPPLPSKQKHQAASEHQAAAHPNRSASAWLAPMRTKSASR